MSNLSYDSNVKGLMPNLMPDLMPEYKGYQKNSTNFCQWAQQHNITHCDGWGMLVRQAAKSFEIWNGCMPDFSALVDLGKLNSLVK